MGLGFNASHAISKIIAIVIIVISMIAVMATMFPNSSPTFTSAPPITTMLTTMGFSTLMVSGVEIHISQGNTFQYILPLDLDGIVNFRDASEGLRLSSEAIEKLKSNGFVVIGSSFNDLSDIYTYINDLGIPIYISSDSILFIYHVFSNQLLIDLEQSRFYSLLDLFLKSLIDENLKITDLNLNPLVREAKSK